MYFTTNSIDSPFPYSIDMFNDALLSFLLRKFDKQFQSLENEWEHDGLQSE